MGKVTYTDGIAILQLVIFPFILGAAIFIWSRTGWRVGSKIWRYPVTLSLIRIAGSISSLLTINHDSYNVEVAVAVCELIGIAPLLLTYIGILRQIDTEQRLPPRFLKLITLVSFIALILGIAGVSSANDNSNGYTPDTIVKVSMAIFIVVFVIYNLAAAWLFFQLSFSMRNFQKKLFMAIVLSFPFILIRVIYSAISDYTTIDKFAVLTGSPTIYLVMDVLEEIVAMALTMFLGMSAVLEEDFVKLTPEQMGAEQKYDQVQVQQV
ncbi:hypothetical protein BO94DRAFT_487504 [Aspergillus sclerotioniger CBS 115572]|uniref:DUF7702 domain-containing protein n=1 Tax=Aspergillus sclerotioniger CBS 115572 TaxID=1450535 RepID=A0A317X3V4_9EURO|nr:hypothetical protein BO94DRAFT_487504 [Aspergillus sclerotioniger CBS 115572]PWY93025.1 hypothetical protein BO94DRAFT_487504 [Aspergillus sclerotioniger CBS 115572]